VSDPRLAEFGRLLAAERRDSGCTVDEVAAATGLSRRTISYLEGGITNPHLTTVVTLARALRCDPARLVRPLVDIPPP
jgi:transcriptional regulator with XRE-family HTH domain